jgi:lipopolysaccharide export system permease protein
MTVLSRYLSWRLTQYMSLALLLLTTLMLAFDLMEEWDDVMTSTHVGLTPLLLYSGLRLPEILANSLPIASVLGGILLVGMLMRHSELVAAWAGGASAFRLIVGLLPVGVGLIAFQFVLNDQLVPHTLSKLYEWRIGDYQRESTIGSDSEAVWLRSGDDIVRIPTLLAQAGQFRDSRIFRRNQDGILVEQIDFRDATMQEDGWVLYDVTRYSAKTGEVRQQPSLPWRGRVDIDNLSLISSGIHELSLMSIRKLIVNEGFGQKPTSLYETWFHHRLSSAIPPFMFICLVLSLAQRFRRTGGIGLLLISSLGLAFAFLVFDNAAFAFGEAGLIPPWVAAWLPKMTLGLLILFFLVRNEG